VTAHLRSDQSICEAHDAVGIPPHGSVPSHLLLSSAITSGGGLSLGESCAIRVVWPCGQRLSVRAVVVATWHCISPLQLNLSARLIRCGTVFFFHSKTAIAGL
jgi:hypothetical protein